jgi:hypothetical protein
MQAICRSPPHDDDTAEGCDIGVAGLAKEAKIDKVIEQVSRVEEEALLVKSFLGEEMLTL